MTVTIQFSETSGGDSLADTNEITARSTDTDGTINPGDDTDWQDLFIRHNASIAAITDCAFYLTRYAGISYLGSDADADFEEIMGWGDASTGGVKISQTIPVGWTEGTEFSVWDTFKNGHGDINSQITLSQNAVNIGTPSGDGEIPVNGEAHVQLKISIPSSVSRGAGYRAFTLVFAYSATS